MELKNYMEILMWQQLDDVLASHPGICTCEKCRYDIAALTMNKALLVKAQVGGDAIGRGERGGPGTLRIAQRHEAFKEARALRAWSKNAVLNAFAISNIENASAEPIKAQADTHRVRTGTYDATSIVILIYVTPAACE